MSWLDDLLKAPLATLIRAGLVQLAGDLGGTATNPLVLKVNGVAITGTPTAGQVATATSGAAAVWMTPYTVPNATTVATGRLQLAGDLGGTATSPLVLKVNGVAITGTPTAGQVPVASNGTTAAWGTPGGGGGGSSTGAYSARPSVGAAGVVYYCEDGPTFVSDGSAWRPVMPLGLGTQPPAASTFTAMTYGGAAATIGDNAGMLRLNVPTSGASTQAQNASFLRPKLATQTLTVQMSLAALNLTPSTLNFSWGICVSTGTSPTGSPLSTLVVATEASTGNAYIQVNRWGFIASGGSLTTMATSDCATKGEVWLRISDDTTHLTYSYSVDGQTWIQVWQESSTWAGPAMDHMGAYVGPYLGTGVVTFASWAET